MSRRYNAIDKKLYSTLNTLTNDAFYENSAGRLIKCHWQSILNIVFFDSLPFMRFTICQLDHIRFKL